MRHVDIVKQLGVNFDEEFECDDGTRCIFASNDVFIITHNPNRLTSSAVLWELKNGYLFVKQKRWKPAFEENYHFVDRDGNIYLTSWNETLTDTLLYKIGNCYEDVEKAKADCDKWVSFYESNEILGGVLK